MCILQHYLRVIVPMIPSFNSGLQHTVMLKCILIVAVISTLCGQCYMLCSFQRLSHYSLSSILCDQLSIWMTSWDILYISSEHLQIKKRPYYWGCVLEHWCASRPYTLCLLHASPSTHSLQFSITYCWRRASQFEKLCRESTDICKLSNNWTKLLEKSIGFS